MSSKAVLINFLLEGVKVRIGLSASLRQDTRLEQRAALEQAIEIKLTQTLALASNFEEMLDKGPDAPREIVNSIVDKLLSKVPQENIREALVLTLSDPQFRDRLVESCESLAVPDVIKARKVVTDYYYHIAAGTGHFVDEEGATLSRPILKGWYDEAFAQRPDPDCKNPASLESSVAEDIKLAKHMEQDARANNQEAQIEGVLRQITEKQDALTVRNTWNAAVENHVKCTIAALLVRDEEGHPILGGFLRELAILKKMRFIIAERTMKRFMSRVGQLSKNDTANSFERPTSNFIGEYVLCCMGVVNPNIFQLNRAEIDAKQANAARSELQELGLDYDKLCDHYALQPSGTIFWNRWAVEGQKPSAVTDELIRSFITQTVWKEKDVLFSAANFPEFFKRVKNIELSPRKSGGSMLSRAERDAALREAFMDFLSQPKFTERIIECIRNKWYEKLDVFYGAGDRPEPKQRKKMQQKAG